MVVAGTNEAGYCIYPFNASGTNTDGILVHANLSLIALDLAMSKSFLTNTTA